MTRKEKWPRTLDQPVNQIISEMSERDRTTVRKTPETELTKFHFGWGTAIRSSFGLWTGNEELLRSCRSESLDADDASMVIISAVWQRLREQREGTDRSPSSSS